MKLSVKTCTLTMPYTEMLDFCVTQGVSGVEIGTGNWSAAPHIDLDAMLESKAHRTRWFDELRRRNLELCALNCSGNPLAYEKDRTITEKTFQLAELLGVRKIVMMSGLPAGCKGDQTPVWITTSWPPETQDILRYQWEDVAIPQWQKMAALAKNCGIEKIALENHAMQLVHTPEALIRLRFSVGDIIGMNLDPSHLFWMGGDPIAAAKLLGEHHALYHLHGKDSRPESGRIEPNGYLDTKPIEEYASRSWNYVAVGHGHDVNWWRDFFAAARQAGYDDYVSLEMEDMSMPVLDGHLYSLKTLKDALNK